MPPSQKVALVGRNEAERLRSKLQSENLLDTGRKIRKVGREVLIPITSVGSVNFEDFGAHVVDDEEPVPRHRAVDPFDSVVQLVDLDEGLKRRLPRKWERIGEVLVVKLPPEIYPHREQVAGCYARVLRARTVLLDVEGIEGDWRTPRVEKIWGDTTITVHLEDGVRFKLDAAKVMFSSGNLPERMRMGHISNPKETVVDLFAGIGYFTIPMAVHSRPENVYACEVNPTAFRFLEENIRINRIDNVVPILGDCRDTAPKGVADRVVMGYLRSQGFVQTAFECMRRSAVLHYHEACPVELADDRPWSTLKGAAEKTGRELRLLRLHRLKSYAPGVSHIVLDVEVTC